MASRDPFACLKPFQRYRLGSSLVGIGESTSTTLSGDPTWDPATVTPAVTPPPPHESDHTYPSQPRSPVGHAPPASEESVVKRNQVEESPLFRRSLIGRRPESPTDVAGAGSPSAMKKIPHGLENPAVKKEKRLDGLKEVVKTGDKRLGQENDIQHPDGMLDDDTAMMDDGDDQWVDEEMDGGPTVILDHAVMSSPIIRLILDHTDSTGHGETVTFQVHRELLKKSTLLSACIGPDTTEIVLNDSLKPYAVSSVVQFLYSGNFTVEDKFQTVEDEEGNFQKLTNVEYTSRFLGVRKARDMALSRLEKSYQEFEFRINSAGMAMRIKMTEWAYGIDEQAIEPGGKIQRLRQRVLGGWCRDVSLIHLDNKLNETFENLLQDYPTFSYDLHQFLLDRVREDGKMHRKLDAYMKAEENGMKRYENQQRLLFPNITRHVSRLQMPTLTLPKQETPFGAPTVSTPVGEQSDTLGMNKPPDRKRATRVADIGEGGADLSRFKLRGL
ncbi:hypothetical protein DRE_00105 [Drechslerella stenobrocha 248]|uniref:BTB domain-containing protein n=1 Tax=Drechslerella stenobrocha 248 TaxID=1043628 RepID=W7IHR0_9PEZI|nr:hypothetical protein DRE_00105 [Drechslerella stenobrocha 248]